MLTTWAAFLRAGDTSDENDDQLVYVQPEDAHPINSTAPLPADPMLNDRICLYRGDITKLAMHAIVNAANKSLLGGGGVDGAIHRAAGKELYQACRKLNGCNTGDAKITPGFNLPSSNVIHTVGPIGEHPDLLARCYNRSLDLAKENNLHSIAFPCISTGVYGYPNEQAAHVALGTVRRWLEENKEYHITVTFCLFLDVDVGLYQRLVYQYFPPPARNDE